MQGAQTLAQVVTHRGLRLYAPVKLEFTNNTPEEMALREYFASNDENHSWFTIDEFDTVTIYSAALLDWAKFFDKVFEHFATYGDEWNEYEQGIDLACSMFENKIGSYGLYGFVRSAAV